MLIINFAQRTRFLLGLGPGVWILLVPFILQFCLRVHDTTFIIGTHILNILYANFWSCLSLSMKNILMYWVGEIILLKVSEMSQQLGACTSFCGGSKFSLPQLRACTRLCGGPKFCLQQLRTYTTFCVGPKFSPRTHIKQLVTTYNYISIKSDTSGLCGHLLSHAYTGTGTYTWLKINTKKNWS